MVNVYQRQVRRAPTPVPATVSTEQKEVPTPPSPSTAKRLAQLRFLRRIFRLFPSSPGYGGLEAARSLSTADHQAVSMLGAVLSHPDALAGAARIGVHLDSGLELNNDDQRLMDQLSVLWGCPNPLPAEHSPRDGERTLLVLGCPLVDHPDRGMVDPWDLLSQAAPNPPEGVTLSPVAPAYTPIRGRMPPVTYAVGGHDDRK